MNKRLVISVILGVLVITAVVVVYRFEQEVKSKNPAIYANENQIKDLKKKIEELRENSNQQAIN